MENAKGGKYLHDPRMPLSLISLHVEIRLVIRLLKLRLSESIGGNSTE